MRSFTCLNISKITVNLKLQSDMHDSQHVCFHY
uniref:Uncharacterized protein n=1 Tax=Rhizophora mucronata TaxID=61149 RepID=A0A2P2J1B7_RHIMU